MESPPERVLASIDGPTSFVKRWLGKLKKSGN